MKEAFFRELKRILSETEKKQLRLKQLIERKNLELKQIEYRLKIIKEELKGA
jgi:hypothetical protein